MRVRSSTLPNVLLVVFDTARADALEPYGAPTGTTPAVAQLASRGTALRSVYATANWTLPSHASMFTGRLPRALGLGREANPYTALRRHSELFLAERMRAVGYRTGAISANSLITPRWGFGAGFERFERARGRTSSPPPGRRAMARWIASAALGRADAGMAHAERILREWIDEPAHLPFFWFVNLLECHAPYLPPRPYSPFGVAGRARAGLDSARYLKPGAVHRYCLGHADVPLTSVDRMRQSYQASITAMDAWLGRVLERLDTKGLLDDTLVLVTSDHGENFGENHLLAHALSLDDRLLRVPLVVAGPGAPASGQGPQSLAGLPALVAEALDLTDHPWSEPSSPTGTVIAQNEGFAVAADSPQAQGELRRLFELDDADVERMWSRMTSVSDGRYKLVTVADEDHLYDLDADPLESSDISSRHPDVIDRLRRVIEAAAASPDAAAATAVGANETDELEQSMRELGYL